MSRALEMLVVCPACKGSGARGQWACDVCAGSGRVWRPMEARPSGRNEPPQQSPAPPTAPVAELAAVAALAVGTIEKLEAAACDSTSGFRLKLPGGLTLELSPGAKKPRKKSRRSRTERPGKRAAKKARGGK